MKVYKGIILPHHYNGSAYHGKTKKYFYSPLKRLFGNWWWVVYYKKNTQFYHKRTIKFLMNYVNVAINEVTKIGNKTYLEEKDLSILNGKNTLLITCYSKQDDTYIGSPYKVMQLINDKNITKYYGDGRNDFAIIGYSPNNKKLYHWTKTNLMEIQTDINLTTENIHTIATEIVKDMVGKREKKRNK